VKYYRISYTNAIYVNYNCTKFVTALTCEDLPEIMKDKGKKVYSNYLYKFHENLDYLDRK